MENIIPISRSNGFEYSAVLLPKDASNIGALNATLYWYAGCPESMGFDHEEVKPLMIEESKEKTTL